MHPVQSTVYTWSYVIKISYGSRRRFSKFRSLTKSLTMSDWVGSGAWGSPIVPLAPPLGV